MVVRIAGLPVWVGPTELVAGAREVLGWTDEAIGVVADLPERVSRLLDVVEGLAGRVGELMLEVGRSRAPRRWSSTAPTRSPPGPTRWWRGPTSSRAGRARWSTARAR